MDNLSNAMCTGVAQVAVQGDDGNYDVESVTNCRWDELSQKLEYLVRFTGYGEEADLWLDVRLPEFHNCLRFVCGPDFDSN